MLYGKYLLISLDILTPSLPFNHIESPFIRFIENGDGELIGAIPEMMVPDYFQAIDYYLKDHQEKKSKDIFQRELISNQIKIAYNYLWEKFKYDVSETTTQQQIAFFLVCFKNFESNIEKYQSYIRWMISQRDKLRKIPEDISIATSIDYMNDMNEISCILACLTSVCQIINQGVQLLTKLNLGNEIVNNEEFTYSFDTYIDSKYRANLIPYIVDNYTRKKSKHIVPMLYALEKLNCLNIKIDTCILTDLHEALTKTLIDIGQYSSFHSAVRAYDSQSKHPEKIQVVENHKAKLAAFLGLCP